MPACFLCCVLQAVRRRGWRWRVPPSLKPTFRRAATAARLLHRLFGWLSHCFPVAAGLDGAALPALPAQPVSRLALYGCLTVLPHTPPALLCSCWTTRCLLWTLAWGASCLTGASATAALWQVRLVGCRAPVAFPSTLPACFCTACVLPTSLPGASATAAFALHCAAGATRLLVTHQRQFLPACDTLLVLRGGEVACRWVGGWVGAASCRQLPLLVHTGHTCHFL